MVFIGLISYSLYLWHWPILVYSKYLNALEPLGGLVYAGVAVSLTLSVLSYYFVEIPFRVNKQVFTRRKIFLGAFAISLLLGGYSVFIWQNKGLPHRFSDKVIAVDAYRDPIIPFQTCDAAGVRDSQANPNCYLGANNTSPSVIVWGDSHALSWAPALDVIFKEKNIAGILAFKSACAPLNGVINPVSPACYGDNKKVFKYLISDTKLENVILIANWAAYSNEPGFYSIENDIGITGNKAVFGAALQKTILVLKENGKHVWLIGSTPSAPSDAPLKMTMAVAKSAKMPAPRSVAEVHSESVDFYRVALPLKNIELINPTRWLCELEFCKYENQGLPLYRDSNHLNVRGALFLKNDLGAALESIAKN
jgi:hypothetical protein